MNSMIEQPYAHCFYSLCIVCVALFAASVQAAHLQVPSEKYPTLNQAVNAASKGDSIILAPGLYHQRIVISEQISLLGSTSNQGEMPIIDGDGKGRVIEISAEGVVVSGIAVRNSGDIIEDSDACIYVQQQANKVQIRHNQLSQCAFGIWVNGSKGILLEENTITGYKKPVFSDRGNGINLWNVRNAIVRDNNIHDVRDGIYLSVTNDSSIEGNHMNNVRFGIHYMYNDNNSVINNVTCNSMVGVALMFSKRLEIKGNAVFNNRDHGILFRSVYDSQIANNIAVGNNKGLFLNDASFNKIHGNWVEGNKIGVHVVAGSEDNEIVQNSFVANLVQVRFSWRFSQPWDGNYWSDYLGWDFNGDKQGDRTYYASNRMDQLLFRYPQLKLLVTSPVVQLLQMLESRFPVLRPASVIDSKPAMMPFSIQGSEGEQVQPADLLKNYCG